MLEYSRVLVAFELPFNSFQKQPSIASLELTSLQIAQG